MISYVRAVDQRHIAATGGPFEWVPVDASVCCAACWVLVQRDVRSDGAPFNFPGMKIVPALAILAIVWILAHATVREFLVTGNSCWRCRQFSILRVPSFAAKSVGKRQKTD